MSIRTSLSAVLVFAVALAASAPADAAKIDPMQRLMQEINKYANAGDAKRTGALLKAVAGLAPRDKDFQGWAGIAQSAATSARRGDLGGAKVACQTCHEKFRDKYKEKVVSHFPDVPDKR